MGGIMKTISAALAVVVVMAWPAVAQVSAQSAPSSVQLKSTACQWDRDRDRDHDRDRDDYRGYGQYHNVLAPEWQQKLYSYYQRWLQYRATNNTGEMQSMEARMRDIM